MLDPRIKYGMGALLRDAHDFEGFSEEELKEIASMLDPIQIVGLKKIAEVHQRLLALLEDN